MKNLLAQDSLLRRRFVATALFVVLPFSSLDPLVPRAAAAYDLDAALAAASLLQIKSSISQIDALLFEELLQQPEANPVGVAMEAGKLTRGRISKLLKSTAGRPRVVLDDLDNLPRRLGQRQAQEALRHARESEENLAAILEYDAVNPFKTDVLGNRMKLMRRDELDFYHRALLSAQNELAAAVDCFGADDRREAGRMLDRSAFAALAPDVKEERESAIVARLAALPDPKGTALTRGDLQATLDAKYVDDLAAGRTSIRSDRKD